MFAKTAWHSGIRQPVADATAPACRRWPPHRQIRETMIEAAVVAAVRERTASRGHEQQAT